MSEHKGLLRDLVDWARGYRRSDADFSDILLQPDDLPTVLDPRYPQADALQWLRGWIESTRENIENFENALAEQAQDMAEETDPGMRGNMQEQRNNLAGVLNRLRRQLDDLTDALRDVLDKSKSTLRAPGAHMVYR